MRQRNCPRKWFGICIVVFALFVLCSPESRAQIFQLNTTATVPGIQEGAMEWGDYDNDGDQDLFLLGFAGGSIKSHLYRNDGSGVFTDINAGLPDTHTGDAAWGDYDNDGDLDLALSGGASTSISRIYRNDGGSFTNIGANLTSLTFSTAAWGDYDNDGDLDLLLAGRNSSGNMFSAVYRNDEGSFTDINAGLMDLYDGEGTWGDYDNDGDLDILITGGSVFSVATYHSLIYRNDNGSFTDINAGLAGVSGGSAAWGDYDSDGDLDVLIAGRADGGGSYITLVYRNDNGSFTDINAGLLGLLVAGVARWGDYDNDGDLDILIARHMSTVVYRNDAGSFTNINAGVSSLNFPTGAWVDYNNDGRLDVAISGQTGGVDVVQIWTNNTTTANTAPVAPVGLTTTALSTSAYRLSWNRASDGETPQLGLSYNVRIGTTTAGVQIESPMADVATGYRRVSALGNEQQSTATLITGLAPGTTYYWSVQAIDGAYAGSAFATSGSFTTSTFALVTTANLPGVFRSASAWGDYDNDGDLDLVIAGDGNSGDISRIYRNDSGSFTDINAGLPGVEIASVSWGDYDNDGDLDLLLAGSTPSSDLISRIYRNDSGSFTDINAGLQGVESASANWGDYDNDGDLDILLTGSAGSGDRISQIYRNDSGSFTDINAGLPGIAGGVAWGDYDNDGDLDILMSGYLNSGGRVCYIYRNNGGVFVDINAGLPGIAGGVAWGDYDNDGDLDITLTGSTSSGSISRVYRNDGGVFTDINAGLPGVYYSSVAWGDYDNDGDLDILLVGAVGVGNHISRVYRNDGGVFTDINTGLTGVFVGSVSWGDYDNDGRIDFLLTGGERIAQLWKNYTPTANVIPDAPTGLAVEVGATSATLSWNRANDTQTPQTGLSYNVRIGTTATGIGVQSPMANVTTGYRRVPALGNEQQTTSTIITGLTPGTTYYWSVQAIDGAYAGSTFATVSSFQINAPPRISTSQTVVSMPEDMQQVLTVAVSDTNNSFDQLTITVTSSNQSLISTTGIVRQGATSATTQFTITPVTNANGGPVSVTIRVTDPLGEFAVTTFSITITPVNDIPVFTTGTNVVVNEDHGGYNTAFATGVDDGDSEATQALSFVVNNDNHSLFTVQPSVHPSGSLSFLPAPNAHGVAVVNVYLTDDGGTENGGVNTSTTQTFTITVNSVNDAPTFSTGANVIVNEDSGAYSAAFATGMNDGDPETTQTLAFTVNNDNASLFSVQPSINATTGILSFTPAAHVHGVAVVNAYLSDDGGTANGGVNTSATQTFTITVNSVNDIPVFSTGAGVVVNEDSGLYDTAFATGIDDGDPETDQALTFVVSNDNPALFSIQPSVSSTGSLSFEPETNAHGTTVVSVYLSDNGGTANGGVNTSATQTFVIIVNSVNDAPSFATSANIVVRDEDGAQVYTNYLTSISPGPADEASQAIAFVVNNNNNALFSAQPSISTNGTLTFTPAQWAQGSAVVYVYAMDNGGTANGGVNTSATQAFMITAGLSPATQLRLASIMPTVQSGQTVNIVVESRTVLGTLRATTAATTLALLYDNMYLPVLSGSTQSTLGAGMSTATISVAFYSSSTANITTPVSVVDMNSILSSTTSSITVHHAVPSALGAATDNQQVSLQWTAPVAMNVTGYAVFRGTSADALVQIGTSATTSYVDNSAVNGTAYFYAVKSASGGLYSGMSATLEVTVPMLTITSPNGGEMWQAGTPQEITWNPVCTVATVAVEYSLDNGGNWITLSSSMSNTGNYSWFVQNPPTTTALVRVYDIARPAVMDMSNSTFEITPVATVTNLTATALINGAQLSWAFSTSTSVTSYELYHGMNPGSLTLLATLPATTSGYTHNGLTDGLSRYYAIRTITGGEASELSQEVSVIPNTLRMIFPNGGEVFQPGTLQTIMWEYSGDISAMTAEYSLDNGANWTAISQTVTTEGNKPLVTFYQEWIIPNAPTTQALVRVVSTYPVEFSDASDAVFSISTLAPPTNLVATANASSIALNWASSTAGTVTGYRVLRGVTTSNLTVLADVGVVTSYEDNTASACVKYYYAVQTLSGNAISGNSNVSSATVMLPASLTLVTPNGGEVWQAGTTKLITWTTTGCSISSSVLLEYSTNDGGSWSAIATTANTGSYSWFVANTPTTQARVRISGGILNDVSNGVFSITPVAAPTNLVATAGVTNIELTWIASTSESVSGYEVWRGTASGSLSLLATTGTTSFTDIAVDVCTTYYYAVRARVGSVISPLSGESSVAIVLPQSLTLNTPNGGEMWQSGTTHLIEWTSTGCSVPTTVMIDYSTNNGADWTHITTTSNSGSYSWLVPNTPTTHALVRITGDALTDVSNAVFAITPVPAPSNLAAIASDETVGLTWTASPAENLTGYEVWRGTTSGSLSLLATVSATTANYTDNSVINCAMYVYAVRATVGTFSSAFSNEVAATPQTTPVITVVSPNGGEVWHGGQVKQIEWTSTGCSVPSSVLLEYSTNNGGSWTTIATVANTGSYSWTVPNTPTVEGQIRVSGGAVNDINDATLTILPTPVPVVRAVQTSVTTGSCIGSASSVLVSITLNDPIYPVNSLVLGVTSSNQSVVANTSIIRQSVTGATTTFLVTASATTSGVSVLTFTASNDFAVGSTTMTLTSTIHPLPVVELNGSTSACAGSVSSYTVPATSGASYQWAVAGGVIVSGQNTREISVQWGVAGSGSVAVVVTSASACEASAMINVTIDPLPVVTVAASGATTFCPGASVVLTAAPAGMHYLWSNGATSQSITVSESGSYFVTLTDQFGCNAMSTTTTVTVHPGVTVDAGSDVAVCQGTDVQLLAVAGSAIGGVTFIWTPSMGLNETHISNPIASPSTTTTYTVVVRDASGCESSDQVTVTVVPATATTLSPNATICAGSSTELTATGGVSYEWSPAMGLSSTTTSVVTASPSTTTTYTVQIATADGCEVSRMVTVTVAPAATADAGSDVNVCAGGSIQLSATGGESYEWTPSTGLSNAFIANPVASPSTTTTYSVKVRTSAGCESTDEITVTVLPVVLDVRVLLEGPHSGGAAMSTGLMAQGLVPINQPYNIAPYNYAGTEVLSTTSTAIVDWVLVELRASEASTAISRKAALLLEDGRIVSSDGSMLPMDELTGGESYYIVLRHRNHSSIMNAVEAVIGSDCRVSYNFTGSATAAYSTFMQGQKELVAGVWGMVAGDADGNGIVNAVDRVMVRNASGELGYMVEDLSLDGIVNALDRVLTRNNVFRASQVP